jgi:hypothetical protein
VLSDRLRHFTRAGIFERVQFPEIPPPFIETHRWNSDFGQARSSADRQPTTVCIQCFHLDIKPKPCTQVQGQAVLSKEE